jgi:hypothetical protein
MTRENRQHTAEQKIVGSSTTLRNNYYGADKPKMVFTVYANPAALSALDQLSNARRMASAWSRFSRQTSV